MKLTNRDIDIVRDHVFAVRVSWEQQILQARWPGTASGRKNGQRRLGELCDQGLLARHLVQAKPVLHVRLLFDGGPSDVLPDCLGLSRECKRGWQLPNQTLTIYTATARARNIFGGLARHHVHALQGLSHDVGTSALFYSLVSTTPEVSSRWRSEDEMRLPAKFLDAQPDAVLVDESGRPDTAIEFASHYESERFQRLWNTIVNEQQLRLRIYGAAP